MRRTRAASLVALGATATLVLAACGGGGGGDGEGGGGDASEGGVYAECASDPNTCNAAPADQLQQGGSITFALEKDIKNWNLLSAEGNVLETGLALKTLLPYTFYTQPDLKSVMNEDLLVSAEVVNESPQTIEYVIQPDAAWNDGTPISAEDFIFNWKVQNGRDCPECAVASTGGWEQVESVVGSEDGKTVTVTFGKTYTDWKGLWGSGNPMYPAHIAAQSGDLNTPEGLAAGFTALGATVPTYSGGPYQIENWEANVALTTVPNPEWYGETQPVLDQLIYRVITDATQEPIALQNNEVQVIYPQPQVDLVAQVENIPGVSQYQGLGLTWEHFDLNLANPFLADEALRDAMFTAVNVQDLVDKTVGQFNDEVAPLKNHNFVTGVEGYEDVLPEGQGSGDVEAAKKILTDAGYTGVGEGQQLTTPDGQAVPAFRIRTTVGNAIRTAQNELFASYVAPLGVKVELVPTDDLGGTLSSGDYDIMTFAWVASPFPFSGAVQNWTTGSGSNFGQYSNPEVDRLISEAASMTDIEAARAKLNESNRIMAEDSYVLPLYQKPTFIAVQDNVANVRNNSSLDGPTYNTHEWGLRAE
jgi:peptide/nickel transport system substrate-binding protein